MERFKRDSVVGLDLADLAPILPSKQATSTIRIHINLTSTYFVKSLGEGEAPWLGDSAILPRRVVIGAKSDFIVDIEGVVETAKFLGTSEILLEGVYHDLMLGSKANYTAGIIWERLA